ncbi:MAG: hypothetical protein GTO41_08105 [Burkholderiales bacterium]|nr:hypothetical protein [Burkholderiales bacterium]
MAKKSQWRKLRDECDDFFSLLVRARDGFACTRCGKYKGLGPFLHASHLIGRSNYAVRWDLRNVWAQDNGCHRYFGSQNHHEYFDWVRQRIGPQNYAGLMQLAQNGRRGRAQWTVDDLTDLRQALLEALQTYTEVLHTAGGAHGYTRLMRQVLGI